MPEEQHPPHGDRKKPSLPEDALPELTEADATRMLSLAISGPLRPVDDLIERLSRPDGAKWLSRVLSAGPTAAFGAAREQIADGKASLEQLRAIKQTSKSLLQNSKDPQSRLTAMVSYFFPVAAALTHYDESICSRPREELETVLLDLAAVTDEPWSSMFSTAALSGEDAQG